MSKHVLQTTATGLWQEVVSNNGHGEIALCRS